MTVYKLVVWTRVTGGSSQAWEALTSPRRVDAALPLGLRLAVDDPDAWERAIAEALPCTVGARVRTPLGPVAWPLEVVDVLPGLRLTTSTRNAWFRRFLHRRRVERAVGGRVRLVDEVILEPRLGVPALVAATTRAVLVQAQGRLARQLDPTAERTTARLFTLRDADVEHADALLSGLDLHSTTADPR